MTDINYFNTLFLQGLIYLIDFFPNELIEIAIRGILKIHLFPALFEDRSPKNIFHTASPFFPYFFAQIFLLIQKILLTT